MNTTLIPYLNFGGTAAEAMKFYQSVLGGELAIQTYADAFPETPEGSKNRTMHADLKSEAIRIMASDTDPTHSPPLTIGNNVSLSLVGSDKEELTRYFNAFAADGRVVIPLEKQFWGDVFGVVEDAFGIYWMVNISATAE